MQHENTGTRVGGIWLAIASLLMAAGLLMHGPIAADPSVQMARIGDHALVWSVAHWMAAAALSLFAVAGLIILTSRAGVTVGPWRTSAWAVVVIGGIWTLNTAVAEATVVTEAAMSGNIEVFEAWLAYAAGKANGFSFLVLALAVIAGSEAGDASRATPSWAAWTASVAGVGSFTGWALGMWLGVAFGSVLWLVSSILVCAWTAWFGLALARSPADALPGTAPPVRQTAQAAYQNA